MTTDTDTSVVDAAAEQAAATAAFGKARGVEQPVEEVPIPPELSAAELEAEAKAAEQQSAVASQNRHRILMVSSLP